MCEPDYKDDLYFEPEFTWEDLVAWATINLRIKYHKGVTPEYTYFETRDYIRYYEDGSIKIEEYKDLFDDEDEEDYPYNSTSYLVRIGRNRTPKQMKTIIENMFN